MTALFRTGVIAGAVAMLVAPAAWAQKVDGPEVQWKIATWGKPRAFTSGIETIRDYVKEKTGGKFNITIGYSTFGGEREILDILSAGAYTHTYASVGFNGFAPLRAVCI